MPTFMGSEAKDTIYGSTEADTIYGLSGDDYISGKSGNDLIYGDAGNDKIYGAEGDDIIYGGDGDDVSNGDDDRDIMFGGLGNDDFDGEKGNDLVFGEDGDDIVDGGHEDDIVYGGVGNDQVWGEGGNDILFGGAGNDIMASDNQVWNVINIWADWEGPQLGNDIVFGEDGDDQISGNACEDFLYGGGGDDTIKGGNGSDFLFGGHGKDWITSEYGINRIFGEAGDDLFDTRSFGVEITNEIKIDLIDGGDGFDRVKFDLNFENYELSCNQNYVFALDKTSKSFFIIEKNIEYLTFKNRQMSLSDLINGLKIGDNADFGQSLVDKIKYNHVDFKTDYSLLRDPIKNEMNIAVENYTLLLRGSPDLAANNYWTGKSVLGNSLLPSSSFVGEGETIIFQLLSPNAAIGSSIPYTIYGVSSSDIEGGALTGSAIINSAKKAFISINVLSDRNSEGREILRLTTSGLTSSVVIEDTSRESAYAIRGTSSNDSFSALSGSETINAGAGSDTVLYLTARSAASVTLNNGTITVSKAGGTDTIIGVERIDFTDGDLVFDVASSNAPAAYRLYGGAFDRTPDEGGFRFWTSYLDKNASLHGVATEFIRSPEFVSRYGASLSNAAFVDALYQNVLHRGGDAGGIAYWNQQLDTKARDRPDVLVQFTQLPEFVGISAANTTNGYWVV